MTSLQRDARVQEIAEAFAAIDRALPMSTTRREVSAAWHALHLLRGQVAALQADADRLQARLDAVREGNVWQNGNAGFMAAIRSEHPFFNTWDEALDAYLAASRSPVPSEREADNG